MYYIQNEVEQDIITDLKSSLCRLDSPFIEKLDLLLHENLKCGAVIKRFVLLLSTQIKNREGIPVCHLIINSVLKELLIKRAILNNTENLYNFIHALSDETVKRFSIKVKCCGMEEWDIEKALATGDLLTVRFMKNLREPVITSYSVENLKELRENLENYLCPADLNVKDELPEGNIPPEPVFPIAPDFYFVDED